MEQISTREFKNHKYLHPPQADSCTCHFLIIMAVPASAVSWFISDSHADAMLIADNAIFTKARLMLCVGICSNARDCYTINRRCIFFAD
jgi:hypothetical protein